MDRFVLFLEEKKRFLLIGLIGIVAAYLYFHFIFCLQMDRVAQVVQQFEAQSEHAAHSFHLDEEISQLEERIAAYEQEIALQQSSLIIPPDIAGLTVQIYRLLKGHNLESGDIVFSDLYEEENYSYFTINFFIQGERQEIYAFFLELENLPGKFGFADCLIVPLKDSLLKAELLLEAYVLPGLESGPPRSSFLPEDYGYESPCEMFAPGGSDEQADDAGEGMSFEEMSSLAGEAPVVDGEGNPGGEVVFPLPAQDNPPPLIYIVQPGETVQSIARDFSLDPAEIILRNKLKKGLVYAGQLLYLR